MVSEVPVLSLEFARNNLFKVVFARRHQVAPRVSWLCRAAAGAPSPCAEKQLLRISTKSPPLPLPRKWRQCCSCVWTGWSRWIIWRGRPVVRSKLTCCLVWPCEWSCTCCMSVWTCQPAALAPWTAWSPGWWWVSTRLIMSESLVSSLQLVYLSFLQIIRTLMQSSGSRTFILPCRQHALFCAYSFEHIFEYFSFFKFWSLFELVHVTSGFCTFLLACSQHKHFFVLLQSSIFLSISESFLFSFWSLFWCLLLFSWLAVNISGSLRNISASAVHLWLWLAHNYKRLDFLAILGICIKL